MLLYWSLIPTRRKRKNRDTTSQIYYIDINSNHKILYENTRVREKDGTAQTGCLKWYLSLYSLTFEYLRLIQYSIIYFKFKSNMLSLSLRLYHFSRGYSFDFTI